MSEEFSSKPDPKPDSTTRKGNVDEQHASINQLLGKLETTTSLPDVAIQLTELQALLKEHFETEESEEGLHTLVTEFAPRHIPHVQRLLEEHKHLLAEVETIQKNIRDILECKTQGICQDVGAFASKLREHEKQEDRIFDDAVYTDTGGPL
jgi:hemerythrin